MTFAEFQAGNVDAEWLELSGCYIDYTASTRINTTRTRRGSKRVSKEYFAAVRSHPDDETPIKMMLLVQDESLHPLMEQSWQMSESEPTVYLNWLSANSGKLFQENVTLSGMVQSGLELSSEDMKILRDAAGEGGTTPDFKIFDPEAEPQAGLGALLIGLGLIASAGGGAWVFLGRKKKPMPHPGQHSPHAHPGQHPHPVAGHPMPPAGAPQHPAPMRPPQASPAQPGMARPVQPKRPMNPATRPVKLPPPKRPPPAQ
jgi:hypothetical protein